MESTIHTLQDYMLHTESITYILIVAALIGITFFFRFLTDRDDDEEEQMNLDFGIRILDWEKGIYSNPKLILARRRPEGLWRGKHLGFRIYLME